MYLLVTPIKNEEENLEKLFSSVFSQSIKPSLWYIINDGSTDCSANIINKYFKLYPDVIICENMTQSIRDITWRYHFIVKHGFEEIIKIAQQKKINWNCIGVLDGDIVIVSKNYFEVLLSYINESKQRIGIVSGYLYSKVGEKDIKEKRYKNRPTGAARLISKEAYLDIGGYPYIPAADSIMLQKARVKGYINQIIPNVKVYQSRLTSSAEGLKIGLEKVAFSKYYIGHTPFFAFLFTIKLLIKTRSLVAFSFLSSFCKSYIKREERTNDPEVIKYRKHYFSNKFIEYFNSHKFPIHSKK